MPTWNSSTPLTRGRAALDVLAPLLGLDESDAERIGDALGTTFPVPPAEGDAFAAFMRTFPAPHARLDRAVADRDETLVAEIGEWFEGRWHGRHAAEADHRPFPQDGRLASVLALVRAMSLSPLDLPDFLGDHLGTSDPLTGDLVDGVLTGLAWSSGGRGLTLAGPCPHPALDVAITQAVERVTALLPEVAEATGTTTAPLRADARLDPTTPRGAAAYLEPGVRFLLAEDRIRSLLMGENLYRRSGLALRELYQNAVDACRHRGARLDFLERTTGERPHAGVAPRVTFAQGLDEAGRAFIECTDTGIGMGLTEIRGAFCQAGIRSADLPEYLQELEDFRQLDPPVRLWTNSRFGVGALSYFMLADEITVVTTRTHRDGSLGHAYRIHIPSAGTYFRIEDLGPGTTPGTSITLSLREGVDVSAVEELRSVVVVAPYELRVSDAVHDLHHTWAPGVLDASSTALSDLARAFHVPATAPDGTTRAWFTAGEGGILADGLWVGRTQDCVVVNLEGEHAPQLSVDRTEVIAYDADAVTGLLHEGVATMASDGEALFQNPDWLLKLARSEPDIADALFEARAALGPWPYLAGFTEVDARDTGMAAVDHTALTVVAQGQGGVMAPWRVSALLAAGVAPELGLDTASWSVLRSVPSDSVALSRDLDGQGPYIGRAPSRGRIAFAATRMRRDVADVVSRLRALGFDVADQDPIDDVDRRVLEGLATQITESTGDEIVVDALDMVTLATTVRLDVAQVIARCARYAIVPDRDLTDAPVTSMDLLVASRDQDGKRPWLSREDALEPHHVVLAANAAQRPVADVCDRLVRLGHTTPRLPADFEARPTDVLILSRDGDGKQPWHPYGDAVSVGAVLRTAQQASLDATVVARRLRDLGYRIAPDGPVALSDPHAQKLLSRDLDGTSPWLKAGSGISPKFMAKAAAACHRPLAEVEEFYRALGFVPASESGGDHDAVITSRDIDGLSPFLDLGDPVAIDHVVGVSAKTGLTISAVRARLIELGYRLDEGAPDPHDAPRETSAPGCFGFAPPQELPTMPGVVQPAGLALAVGKKRGTLGDLSQQLDEYGVRLLGALPDAFDKVDRKLLTTDLDAMRPIRDIRVAVGRVTVVWMARRLRLDPHDVVRRLRRFGYVVDLGDEATPLPSRVGKKLFALIDGSSSPTPAFDARVPAGTVLKGASELRIPIARACRILRRAGIAFVDPREVFPIATPGAVDPTLVARGEKRGCGCGNC